MMLPGLQSFTLMRLGVFAVAMVLVGCGSAPKPVSLYDGKCMGMADNLKTLRIGDELPRVVQVLGMPTKSHRVSLFGPRSEVLEYDVGNAPCARTMLGALDSKIYLGFDGKGRYKGQRNSIAFFGSVQPLALDPVVLWP